MHLHRLMQQRSKLLVLAMCAATLVLNSDELFSGGGEGVTGTPVSYIVAALLFITKCTARHTAMTHPAC